MSIYKSVLNPFNGQLQLVVDSTIFQLKEAVASQANLPLTGNSENDVRITKDTDLMYTWSIAESSGTLDKWIQIGSVSSVDWSSITNKPISSVEDIDNAVSNSHAPHSDDQDLSGKVDVTDFNDLVSVVNSISNDNIKENAYNIDLLNADVTLTDTDASALQTAITALTDGQVLEVKTNASYNPIQIPSGKSFVLKNVFGYAPKIIGQNAITLLNGASDVKIAGFVLENNTTGDNNAKGACIALAHQAKVSDIVFYNLCMREVSSGSAVMMSYHQTINGDNYATAPTISEMSSNISFINCHFSRACKDNTEGGALTVRGINKLYVADCHFDNQNLTSRGIQVQDCINSLIEYNEVLNVGGSNAEAIKFDEIGTMVGYRITGIVRRNKISGCREGIDVDDKCDIIAIDNNCSNCLEEGISVDDSARAILIHNVCFNNVYGIRLESGSVVDLKNNICFNNSSSNYQIENGYTLDNSNSTSIADALMIPTANNVPFGTTTVKSALETLDTNKLSKNSIAGSFTTNDGKTITVVDGQITAITS